MLKHKQSGFSFIELLIGMFISLLVLGSFVYFLSNLSAYSTKAVKTMRLEYELQTILDLISHDIRRAGFWSNASNMIGTGANTNPFMVAGTSDITTPSTSCILFTYDLNQDGLLPALGAATSDERFGYRLSSAAIQSRAMTDSTYQCDAGSWENVSNPNIVTITNATFTLNTITVELASPPTTESLFLRYVNLSLTGQLADDPTVVTTLSTNIKVRNDKYQP